MLGNGSFFTQPWLVVGFPSAYCWDICRKEASHSVDVQPDVRRSAAVAWSHRAGLLATAGLHAAAGQGLNSLFTGSHNTFCLYPHDKPDPTISTACLTSTWKEPEAAQCSFTAFFAYKCICMWSYAYSKYELQINDAYYKNSAFHSVLRCSLKSING